MNSLDIKKELREKYCKKYRRTPNCNKMHYIDWLQDEYVEIAMRQANGEQQPQEADISQRISGSFLAMTYKVC